MTSYSSSSCQIAVNVGGMLPEKLRCAPSSVSFIHKAGVLARLVLRAFHCFVGAGAWHVRQHLLVSIGEVQRVGRLLELTLDFAPLGAHDGFRSVVGTGSWGRLLRDHPVGGRLGVGSWLDDARREELRFRYLDVCVVVFGGRVLLGDPLLVLSEVHSVALSTDTRNSSQTSESEWSVVLKSAKYQRRSRVSERTYKR